MIYVTGDLHGEKAQMNRYWQALSAGDILIIAGDFGLPWWSPEASYWTHHQEIKLIQKLADAPFTTCFVDGNHENFDLLETYPTEEKWGGHVQNIEGVYHLLRGELYNIEGRRIFTFGGATSVDKHFRKENLSWWAAENASSAEKEHGLSTLEKANWQVDYIITHTAPEQFLPVYEHAMFDKRYLNCPTQAYLTELCKRVDYKKWYFGHFHDDKKNEQLRAHLLFDDIVPIES